MLSLGLVHVCVSNAMRIKKGTQSMYKLNLFSDLFIRAHIEIPLRQIQLSLDNCLTLDFSSIMTHYGKALAWPTMNGSF